MATIATDPNGRKGIQFTDLSGKRQELRLGKATRKQAEAVLAKVESIRSDLAMNRPHDPDLADWIKRLPPMLMERMRRLGLVPGGVNRQSATLGDFLTAFFQTVQGRVKPSTETMYRHTRRNLVDFFGANRPIRLIGVEDAEKFRTYLANLDTRRGSLRKLSDSTINRRIRVARLFFGRALKWEWINKNPFTSVKAGDQINKARQYFVSREETEKLLTVCPNAQWRLLVALARYGGLRCPSEILLLKWEDVNWAEKRILVHSPKTEHHAGKDCRTIPMFPELEKPLLEVFGEAQEGVPWVITQCPAHRNHRRCNFGTHLTRLIKRAGLTPWPKRWQNMRATRETELAEMFPMQVVCAWIGNSPKIAESHYLQITDAHFAKAVETVPDNPPQNPPQQTAEGTVIDGNAKERPILQISRNADECLGLSVDSLSLSFRSPQSDGPEWSRTIDLVVISDAL
jgi:integrase